MSTPQGTPLKHVKLGIVSAKSLPLTNEFKRLLGDQHQRLSLKHQQDLDLIDDIRGYVKARLSIEKDYTNALQKLAKQHANHITKKFHLLHQLEQSERSRENAQQQQHHHHQQQQQQGQIGGGADASSTTEHQQHQQQNQSNHHNHQDHNQPSKASSLYRVWSDHINCLQNTAKNRADQFEQSNLIVDKLKDIRQHKASIGKKCLDTHLKRIQEELLASVVDVDKAKKLYYEDESQAKKARENEERIKKKRSGLLTKFTDLQAKKEKSSAQREATDIQSTQARNDYIMALAAANAHLNYYYYRDLSDFIHLIDDGVLDHCKIFMATLSECDINSLKDSLSHAQYWSRLINLTGSQQTNQIFLDCEQSKCLKDKHELQFEACNNDPIQKISLEHNADYALQHEIDKWFTWFKKECRNLSQLMHQLDTLQQAFTEGKKSIEFNGQTIDDLEPKIIELKQAIRKCEAAKLKAQSRLMVIKEGGMQIEEWSAVELEIRADMARAQEEQQRAKRLKELDESREGTGASFDEPSSGGGAAVAAQNQSGPGEQTAAGAGLAASSSVHLQVSHDSDDNDSQTCESMHNLASVSRSTSNLMQKQQQAMSGYSALTDPSIVWQDDYSAAWGGTSGAAGSTSAANLNQAFDDHQNQQQQQPVTTIKSPTSPRPNDSFGGDLPPKEAASGYDLLNATSGKQADNQQLKHIPSANMSIQSSSPLSAIVNGGQHLSQSPYQGAMSEAYKSDYECDYTRSGQHPSVRSAASSVEPSSNQLLIQQQQQANEVAAASAGDHQDVDKMLNRPVIALYKFEKNNEDDLEFEEGDLLEVIDINSDDTNWVRARHLATGEDGYIPSSYVRLHDGTADGEAGQETQQQQQASAWSSSSVEQTAAAASRKASSDAAGHRHEQLTPAYCRALYDYSPEANTFEEDGLPHLALMQGELCKIIDQGEDDGWWLVEKEDLGARGHVPSMLVEEVDPNEHNDEDDDEGLEDGLEEEFDDDDGDVTDEDEGIGGMAPPAGPPPNLQAPQLEVIQDETEEQLEDQPTQADDVESEPHITDSVEVLMKGQEDNKQREGAAPSANNKTKQTGAASSLIPTSFIIIEPTPEVESRRIEDELGVASVDDDNNDDGAEEPQKQDEQISPQLRQIVQSNPPPASQVSYSVINEDFVLEKPTRKPNASVVATTADLHHHHPSSSSALSHHEPTILESEEELDAQAEQSERSRKRLNEQEIDVSSMPAPPEVVIDSVEAIPRSPDLSFEHDDYDNQDDQSQTTSQHYSSSHDPTSDTDEPASTSPLERKHFKHTGFVDISPILRHHAEEFTKQLIEEAIMLAPGSRIGPSTSSAELSDPEEGNEGNIGGYLENPKYDYSNNNNKNDDDDQSLDDSI